MKNLGRRHPIRYLLAHRKQVAHRQVAHRQVAHRQVARRKRVAHRRVPDRRILQRQRSVLRRLLQVHLVAGLRQPRILDRQFLVAPGIAQLHQYSQFRTSPTRQSVRHLCLTEVVRCRPPKDRIGLLPVQLGLLRLPMLSLIHI